MHHYSLHTERSYIDWIKREVGFRTIRELPGHRDVDTTLVYPRVLRQGGQGVPCPLDDL